MITVIDFETANADRGSICSVGVVVIRNGVMFRPREVLIKPHCSCRYFSPFNIQIHGITPDRVCDAPEWGDFFPKLAPYLEGATVVAHNAAFFDGSFVITAPTDTISLCHIERQGYPFFAGEITVERTLTLNESDTSRMLAFDKAGINALRVSVNGHEAGTLLWRPYTLDLSPYLHAGDNVIRLTLVNNLRNLLGPHHHTGGELLTVGPGHFYKEPCIWTGYGAVGYTEKYCFVHTSLYNEGKETI